MSDLAAPVLQTFEATAYLPAGPPPRRDCGHFCHKPNTLL